MTHATLREKIGAIAREKIYRTSHNGPDDLCGQIADAIIAELTGDSTLADEWTQRIANEIWSRRHSTISQEEGWQDIATAPKDGTLVDLWEDGRRHANVFWHAPQDSWASYSWRASKRGEVHRVTTSHVGLAPSHWRPLPAPPLPRQGEA